MKSDTLVTLLMGILAVFFGVINAKNKKKKRSPESRYLMCGVRCCKSCFSLKNCR